MADDQFDGVNFDVNFQMDLWLLLKKHGLDEKMVSGKWYTLQLTMCKPSTNGLYLDRLSLAPNASSSH